nr:transposase DNA-binding-containing protein [Serratia proteamaculans]
MGNSLPCACQDRTATKAVYRFLSSTKVDEQTPEFALRLCTC